MLSASVDAGAHEPDWGGWNYIYGPRAGAPHKRMFNEKAPPFLRTCHLWGVARARVRIHALTAGSAFATWYAVSTEASPASRGRVCRSTPPRALDASSGLREVVPQPHRFVPSEAKSSVTPPEAAYLIIIIIIITILALTFVCLYVILRFSF